MVLVFRKRVLILLILFSLLAPVIAFEASDGSIGTSPEAQWRTYKCNLNRSGSCSYYLQGNLGEVLWKTQLYSTEDSSPVIDDEGNIYIGANDGKLYSVSPEGNLNWAYSTSGEIRSSPTLDPDDNIYFSNIDGFIFSITTGGSLNWEKNLNSSIYSSPLYYSNVGLVVGTSNGTIFCLDPADGGIRWIFHADGAIMSSPALLFEPYFYFDHLIFSSRDGYLYDLYENGTFNWKYYLGGATDSTPAISHTRDIYITSDDQGLHCINRDGEKVWRYPTWDTGWCSPSTMDDNSILYVDSSGVLNCLSHTGGLSWDHDLKETVSTSPVISADNRIILGTNLASVYCISELGDVIWKTDLTVRVASTPAIDENGNVIVADTSGWLYKIGSRPREVPSPPINVSAEVGDMSIEITWDPPQFEGNTSILGYTIMRWDNWETDPIIIGTTEWSAYSFVDIYVDAGKDYYYVVTAFNEVGDSDTSDMAVGQAIKVPQVPGIPRNLRYSVNGDIVVLQWSAPTYEGTAPVTSYHVYRFDSYGSVNDDMVLVGVTEYIDQVPQKGQVYYYSVAAINDVGEGQQSEQERVFVKDDTYVIIDPPSESSAENSESSSDIASVVCCLLFLFMAVGIPIFIIIMIQKAIKGSETKKSTKKIWMDTTPRKPKPPPMPPKTLQQKPQRAIETKTVVEWEDGTKYDVDEKDPIEKAGDILDRIEEERPEEDDILARFDVPDSEVPEEIEPEFTESAPPVEMDLVAEEIPHEPEMPQFERPKALTDQEKDDFIVERIMELQAMLNDGDIDQEMYDTLKKRLLDQLED